MALRAFRCASRGGTDRVDFEPPQASGPRLVFVIAEKRPGITGDPTTLFGLALQELGTLPHGDWTQCALGSAGARLRFGNVPGGAPEHRGVSAKAMVSFERLKSPEMYPVERF